MSKIDLLVKIQSYSDAPGVVVPLLKEFDWSREIKSINSDYVNNINMSCSSGLTIITLPSPEISLLYVECDNEISVRLNGDTLDLNVVSPSASGTMDGIFLKRGAITSLVINNSNLEDVNIKVFMGV